MIPKIIYKDFFRFVLPSMLSFALSGVYAIADGFFVGNELGDYALAAINVAYPITAMLQAVGTGIGMGGAIQYAIHTGAGNKKRSSQYFGMALLLLLGSGLLLTALFLLIAPFVLELFGASGQIMELAREYIRLIAIGSIFQVLGTGMVPFIRNMGGANASMIAMVSGFLTNILLDYLLVWKLPHGMAGAAAATVIGQAVTLMVCILFLIKKKEKPVFSFQKEGGHFIRRICTVGLSPFGLTYSPNITLILINKSAVLYGGDLAVTCYASVSYIVCVVQLLLQGVSDGTQPLISLAHGRRKEKDARMFRNLCYGFSTLVAAACIAALFLTRNDAARLFGASDQVTAAVGEILPIFLAGFFCVGFSRTTISYFYAMRENARAYVLIYGEPILLFLILLFLPRLAGLQGTWLSVLIAQILIFCFSIILLFWRQKEHRKNIY